MPVPSFGSVANPVESMKWKWSPLLVKSKPLLEPTMSPLPAFSSPKIVLLWPSNVMVAAWARPAAKAMMAAQRMVLTWPFSFTVCSKQIALRGGVAARGKSNSHSDSWGENDGKLHGCDLRAGGSRRTGSLTSSAERVWQPRSVGAVLLQRAPAGFGPPRGAAAGAAPLPVRNDRSAVSFGSTEPG